MPVVLQKAFSPLKEFPKDDYEGDEGEAEDEVFDGNGSQLQAGNKPLAV